MEIGVGLDPTLRLTAAEQAQVVQEALRLGYVSAWTPAGAVSRDAFHVCAQWSAAGAQVAGEPGLRTGIAVVPVAHWTAPQLAATAGTVGERCGGRFVLGVGTGGAYSAAQQQAYGLPAQPPLPLMRDYLTVLRRLLAGERVEYEGRTLSLHGVQLAFQPPRVPVYLGALGPRMVRLAGEAADGVSLNWCTPEQVAWSRQRVEEGSRRAGRAPAEVRVMEYIRVCVDGEEAVARRGLARATLGYAMARPGVSKALGYRAHFTRMGFDAILSELEARRDAGASQDEVAEACPAELLSAVGYFGPAAGARAALRRLSAGLDEAVVRVVPARPGVEAVLATLRACRPPWDD
ncbi:MAG TPA: LLM class flavin-dependent oxidoreductase [Chloroflexota bacterium]|jgi:alkanesulfonate monooxygenase SsuD/methylene tetrahydromethanopterin reductase-like flavin-dependent oxidoreductase (luciferase family)|nr:LLM class flavin-dependent oxidoreductase [Chloroflexota bacterium]